MSTSFASGPARPSDNPFKPEGLRVAWEQGRVAHRRGLGAAIIDDRVVSPGPRSAWLQGYFWKRGESRWKLLERIRKLMGSSMSPRCP